MEDGLLAGFMLYFLYPKGVGCGGKLMEVTGALALVEEIIEEQQSVFIK